MSVESTDKAEADTETDEARVDARQTGGVADPDAPDQQTTTGPTDTPDYVGRIAGDDIGYAEETGAERRAEADG